MTTLREAAEIGHDYIHDALTALPQGYIDHPSMPYIKDMRDSILADLEAMQKALAQKDECETCAAKRQKLTEAGLLASPMREVEMTRDERARAIMAIQGLINAEPECVTTGLMVMEELSKDEPEMPIDRGAWADVPNATKWVDELRGDEKPLPDVVEPVVYVNESTINWFLDRNRSSFAAVTALLRKSPNEDCTAPLYTSPPPREWVGLTEEEAAECWSSGSIRTWQAIEAKLKEKNT